MSAVAESPAPATFKLASLLLTFIVTFELVVIGLVPAHCACDEFAKAIPKAKDTIWMMFTFFIFRNKKIKNDKSKLLID